MAQKYRPLTSVLVKPSGPDCNLGCTYCFYLEKEALFPEHKIHQMSPEIQEEMIRQVMQVVGRFGINWLARWRTSFDGSRLLQTRYRTGKEVWVRAIGWKRLPDQWHLA